MKNRNINTQTREIGEEMSTDLQYVLSDFYRQCLSRKIRAALAAAKANGVRLGRPPKKKQGAVKKDS